MVTFVYFSPKKPPLFNSHWEFFCRQSAKICPQQRKKKKTAAENMHTCFSPGSWIHANKSKRDEVRCIQLDKWSTASVTENRPHHHHHAHLSIYLSICVLLNWIPFAQDKSSYRFSCCVGDQHEGSNWLPHHSLFQTHETMCSGSRQVTNIRCQTQEKIITRRRRLLYLR
jgi:hypothetical protein